MRISKNKSDKNFTSKQKRAHIKKTLSASSEREKCNLYSPSIPCKTLILLQYACVDGCKEDVCQHVVQYVRVDCLKQPPTPPEQNRSREGGEL